MSKTISEEEAFQQLETMFPGYERNVLSDFLDSNSGNLSRTIEQLLKINAEEVEVKNTSSSTQYSRYKLRERKSVGSVSTASTGHVRNDAVEEDYKSAFDSDNESPACDKQKSGKSEEENPEEEDSLKQSTIYDQILAATLQQEEVKEMDDEMVIDKAIRESLISLDSDEVSRIRDFEKRAHHFFKKVHMQFDEYGHQVLHEEIINVGQSKGRVVFISGKLEKGKKKKYQKLR